MTNNHSSEEDFIFPKTHEGLSGTLVEKLPEGKDLPFEIDPDKRVWEYDGYGNKVPKTP